MTIQLQEMASVVQGVNVARIDAKEETEHAKLVKVLTLKEFNESMGLPYRLEQDNSTRIWIKNKQIDNVRFTEENMIVIHLLSQRVASIPLIYEELLIPSNFVVVDFHQQVDSNFVAWYFNEHVKMRKQFKLATQGSSVSSLSISMLREVAVKLPPIKVQMRIGKIVQAVQQKKRLMEERIELEEQYINELLSVKMEELK